MDQNVGMVDTKEIQPESNLQPVEKSIPWGKIAIWIFLLGLLYLIRLGLIRSQQGPIGVGAKLPAFTFTSFSGETMHTEDLNGKVVVINFWASWCKTCEQEAIELERAYQLYADKGVVFLGVDYVDTEPEALAYLDRFGITYPNGPDLRTEISQAFRIRAVPETYIVGRDGRLASVKIGPYLSLQEITTAIDQVLSE